MPPKANSQILTDPVLLTNAKLRDRFLRALQKVRHPRFCSRAAYSRSGQSIARIQLEPGRVVGCHAMKICCQGNPD